MDADDRHRPDLTSLGGSRDLARRRRVTVGSEDSQQRRLGRGDPLDAVRLVARDSGVRHAN
jgi:hypothetical protein